MNIQIYFLEEPAGGWKPERRKPAGHQASFLIRLSSGLSEPQGPWLGWFSLMWSLDTKEGLRGGGLPPVLEAQGAGKSMSSDVHLVKVILTEVLDIFFSTVNKDVLERCGSGR